MRPLRTIATVVALVLQLAACGPATRSTGEVDGRVTWFNCVRPDFGCPETGVQKIAVYFQPKTGQKPFIAWTDANGAYMIHLPEGTYGVDVPGAPSVAENGSLVRIVSGPTQITVKSGQIVIADLRIPGEAL